MSDPTRGLGARGGSSDAVLARAVEMFDELQTRSVRFDRFVMNQIDERRGHFLGARESGRLRRPDLSVVHRLAQRREPVFHPRAGPVVKRRQQERAELPALSCRCVQGAKARLQERGSVGVRDRAALEREVHAVGG